ncbi:MAG: glycosyltransferase [bacterium]|nr:glycosyltransferase [bacterium]
MTWLAPGGGVDRNVYLSVMEMRVAYEQHLAVGHEIHRRDFFDLDGIAIHVCPTLDRAIRPWRDLRALIWFVKLIRRERYDIIHTHETKASLIGRIAGWLAGCPHIIYGLHGVVFNDPMSALKRRLYIYLERWTIGCAHTIVAVGQETLDVYHANTIGRDLKGHVVYSGIDVGRYRGGLSEADKRAFRRKLGIADRAKVLVNIGRFSVAKAQQNTIRAFAKLRAKHRDLHLLLVGEGPEQAACEALCRELDVMDHVMFAGFCADVVPAYAIADVHILTSLREGLPSVAVEASLSRVPTVAYEVEGVREIVTHGKTGFVVPQGDLDGLVDCVEVLLMDPAKCRAFGDNAFTWAIERWDHRIMVSKLDALYRDMLKGTNGKV